MIPIALEILFLVHAMYSIQLNFTSKIIPRYLAEYPLVIEALSITKSLQLALFNLALWKTMKKVFCLLRGNLLDLNRHLKKSVQHLGLQLSHLNHFH